MGLAAHTHSHAHTHTDGLIMQTETPRRNISLLAVLCIRGRLARAGPLHNCASRECRFGAPRAEGVAKGARQEDALRPFRVCRPTETACPAMRDGRPDRSTRGCCSRCPALGPRCPFSFPILFFFLPAAAADVVCRATETTSLMLLPRPSRGKPSRLGEER